MVSDHAANYKLAEARQNQRLAEFRAANNLASLSDEISLARLLIEDRLAATTTPAERAGALPMVRDMLAVLGNLCKNHHARQQENGELLAKPAIVRLANQMVNVVADELRDLEDCEDRLLRIAERIGETIVKENNEEEDK